jgi:hypothetical protein
MELSLIVKSQSTIFETLTKYRANLIVISYAMCGDGRTSNLRIRINESLHETTLLNILKRLNEHMAEDYDKPVALASSGNATIMVLGNSLYYATWYVPEGAATTVNIKVECVKTGVDKHSVYSRATISAISEMVTEMHLPDTLNKMMTFSLYKPGMEHGFCTVCDDGIIHIMSGVDECRKKLSKDIKIAYILELDDSHVRKPYIISDGRLYIVTDTSYICELNEDLTLVLSHNIVNKL